MKNLSGLLFRNKAESATPVSSGFFFGRKADSRRPFISVICLNKNHRKFLETSVLSVLSQDFDRFELIVVDGGSTDGSREFLMACPFVRLIDDPNSSRYKGILRGYTEARGDIVMITTSTDGYLCRGWFQRVYDTLQSRPEVSLVWGSSALMGSDETLGRIVHPADPFNVPQLQEMFEKWIEGGLSSAYLPELNYGIRKSVLQDLLSDTAHTDPREIDPVLHVLSEFYRQGYLPFYLPITASFGRTHDGQMQHSPEHKRVIDEIESARQCYSSEIKADRTRHVFRSGNGKPIVG